MPRTSPAAPPRSKPWRLLTQSTLAVSLAVLSATVVWAAVRSTPAAPTLTVQAEQTMQGAKISLRGEAWAPRAELAISATAPPGADKPLDLGTAVANADGDFRATKLSPCTTPTAPDAKATVLITVRAGDQSAQQSVSAAHWVCLTTP